MRIQVVQECIWRVFRRATSVGVVSDWTVKNMLTRVTDINVVLLDCGTE